MRHGICVALSLGLLLTAGTAFASGDDEEGEWVRGSGVLRSESRQVPDFDAVALEGSGEVVIRPSARQAVRIRADDNLLPLLKTEVVDGVLHLGFKSGVVASPTRLEFSIAVPRLTAITDSGSGSIRTTGPFAGESLVLTARGSGDIACEVEASRLEITVGGSGSIAPRGRADHLRVAVNGSGSVRARDLSSAEAEVTINGSGSAEVWATATLSATVNGSGSVRYGGGAAATVQTRGSGSVQKF